MISAYHTLAGSGKYKDEGNRSSNFVKHREKYDYHSLIYLLNEVYGLKSSRIFL